MNPVTSLLESDKSGFCLLLKEKMSIAEKHNWREKVFEQALKAFLARHEYRVDLSRSYDNGLGLQCDIAVAKSEKLFLEVKRFRSPEACVSVEGGPSKEWAGELKGFPRDFLVDVAKVVLASSDSNNIQGVAIAFIAIDKDDIKNEVIGLVEKTSKISKTFNLEFKHIDYGVFFDSNDKPTRLLAMCIASKLGIRASA